MALAGVLGMTGSSNTGQEARRLVRRRHYGVLSTSSQKFPGYPFGSFVDYVTDHLGRPVILISALAEHTHNIIHQARVSLAVHDPGTQAQAMPRLCLMGEARLIGPDDAQHIRSRYLRYFPDAAPYLELDFAFYRIEPLHVRFIEGMAKTHWVSAMDYMSLGSRLANEEESLIATLQGAATSQLVGIDCDGCDIRRAGEMQRLEFSVCANEAAEVRVQLTALQGR